MSYSQCFAVDSTVGDDSKASEVFKQLAFREPRCGDCGARLLCIYIRGTFLTM